MEERPFLSILTRCSPFREPHFLERNKASVAAQTDQDLEHVLVVGGNSFPEAIRSVAKARPLVHGKVVVILDDDDFVGDPECVAKLKEVWEREEPDVIMIRSMRLGIPFPTEKYWGERPVSGRVGCQNYVVRGEVWQEHIQEYSRHTWGGDHHFIRLLWDLGFKFYWLDELMIDTDQVGVLGDHKGRRVEEPASGGSGGER